MKNEFSEILPVFVYGTLRRGEKNYASYLLGNTSRQMPGHVDGYAMFGLGNPKRGFPAIIPGGSRVSGDVMWLKEPEAAGVMTNLDYLEGFRANDHENPRNLYRRTRELVKLETGGAVWAWVYLWNGDHKVLDYPIESGDWKKRLEAYMSAAGH